MFGTVIETDAKGDRKLNKKYFALCPELFEVYKDKNLGSKMLKYIVNVYDRKSIYYYLALDVRKEEVCDAIWGKKTHPRINSPKVLRAIELYEYVQYDPLIDQYQSMVNKNKQKINIYNLMEVTEKNIGHMNEIEAKMQKSTEGLEKLRERIKQQEEEREILGSASDSLSFIEERLQQRQRQEEL